MERINIFFLHGFLGIPQDWEEILKQVKLPTGAYTYLVDYFHDPSLNAFVPLNRWGIFFNDFVRSKKGTKNILVGYSLGGRLGLHALADDPHLWTQAIFISTNPGFDDKHEGFEQVSVERSKRWLNDTYWAEKFGTGEWSSILKAWNAQPIFGTDMSEPLREEKKYSREALSMALTNWSLAQQKNMRPLLAAQVDKISWIVGGEDQKFTELSQALLEHAPGLRLEIIEGSAHRVIFDGTLALTRLLENIFCHVAESTENRSGDDLKT